MKAPMNDALRDTLIRYLFTLPQRKRLQTAVCDAIEGFCDATCIYTVERIHEDSDLYWMDGDNWNTTCGLWVPRRHNDLPHVCSKCNRRVIEQFDILKEEGV